MCFYIYNDVDDDDESESESELESELLSLDERAACLSRFLDGGLILVPRSSTVYLVLVLASWVFLLVHGTCRS